MIGGKKAITNRRTSINKSSIISKFVNLTVYKTCLS